jgi:protein LSM14
LRLQVGILI